MWQRTVKNYSVVYDELIKLDVERDANGFPIQGGPHRVHGLHGFGKIVKDGSHWRVKMERAISDSDEETVEIHTSKPQAIQSLQKLREKHNAYRCWVWVHRDDPTRLMFVHRLHPEKLMSLANDRVGRAAVLRILWLPERDRRGHWRVVGWVNGKRVCAHRYIAEQYGHDDWKVRHVDRYYRLDNHIEYNLKDANAPPASDVWRPDADGRWPNGIIQRPGSPTMYMPDGRMQVDQAMHYEEPTQDDRLLIDAFFKAHEEIGMDYVGSYTGHRIPEEPEFDVVDSPYYIFRQERAWRPRAGETHSPYYPTLVQYLYRQLTAMGCVVDSQKFTARQWAAWARWYNARPETKRKVDPLLVAKQVVQDWLERIEEVKRLERAGISFSDEPCRQGKPLSPPPSRPGSPPPPVVHEPVVINPEPVQQRAPAP